MILFSRDEAFVQLLRGVYRQLRIIAEIHELGLELDADKADAIIVDCDDHLDGFQALHVVKKSKASRASACIAILNGQTQPADAQHNGAWVVFEKIRVWKTPSAIEQWLRTIRKREHYRFPVNDLALIDSGGIIGRQVTLVNISLGGASFATRGVDELERQLTLRLVTGRFPCDVVWSDSSGKVGVRFLGDRFTQEDLRRVLGGAVSD